MEVNERVITILFSSAVGSATVRPQNLESSESTAHVMPMVGKMPLVRQKIRGANRFGSFPGTRDNDDMQIRDVELAEIWK